MSCKLIVFIDVPENDNAFSGSVDLHWEKDNANESECSLAIEFMKLIVGKVEPYITEADCAIDSKINQIKEGVDHETL